MQTRAFALFAVAQPQVALLKHEVAKDVWLCGEVI